MPESPTAPPFGPVPTAGHAEHLVPPDSTLRSWAATVLRATGRNWRPALFVTGVSVAVPPAAVELARGITEAAGHRAPATLTDVGSALGEPAALALTVALPALLLLLAGAGATIGWAGGVWALTGDRLPGGTVTLQSAYRFGLGALRSLWPWALVATVLLVAGLYAFVVPGVYLLFALSMCSFPVLFERSRRPLLNSFALTHRQPGRALARWGVLAAAVIAFEAVLSLFFGVVGLVLLGDPGIGAAGHGPGAALIDSVHTAVGAPSWALLVIWLTVTHADLHSAGRARRS